MKVLLHICCGPCSIAPVQQLRDQGHQLQGYFFNPNIHPYKEFRRRLDTLQEYAAAIELPLLVDDRYLLEEFLQRTMQLGCDRCENCYEMRFLQAALQAKNLQCEAFTTTLLVSPYQKHDLIRQVGERVAEVAGIPFLYQDFRSGWKAGVDISRQREMYRQPYCGCIFSEKERYYKAKNEHR
jgi:predicted adenine nucleotide alpha hydrolase (AANH) superfamily ATPase